MELLGMVQLLASQSNALSLADQNLEISNPSQSQSLDLAMVMFSNCDFIFLCYCHSMLGRDDFYGMLRRAPIWRRLPKETY